MGKLNSRLNNVKQFAKNFFMHMILHKSITSCGIILLLYISSETTLAQKQSIEFEGISRDYEVYLPKNFEPNMPLVINLHGYTEPLSFFREFTDMHNYADTAGFVVVYPEGISLSWNIGIKYDPIRSPFPKTDDVGFISALIDTLYTQYLIDLNRVYCCGFSTGGEMTCRLALQLGERFAAIASVSGGFYDPFVNWHPIKSIPVMHIHGTNDRNYLYYGPGSIPGIVSTEEMWNMEETLDFWTELNECNKPVDTIDLPDLVLEDSCTAQKITFTGDLNNAPVILYKISGGGHTWPGSLSTLGSWEGFRNMDFGATEEIWNFFKQYENSLVNLARSKSLEVSSVLVGDSLTVRSYLNNPDNHSINVFAIIQGEQSGYSDTLQLIDDGLHHDGDPLDNLWGNKKELSGLPEDSYLVDLVTHDQSFDLKHFYHQPASLINFGPVELENYSFYGSDSMPNPGDRIKLYLTLKNNSASAIATNLEANLTSINELVSVLGISRSFDDIPSGESVTSARTFSITISENCPVNAELPIQVNIYSHDNLCWIDTLNIQVVEPDKINNASESTTRIFPNPSDGIINIETEYFDNSTIEIYNIRGVRLFSTSFQSTNERIDISGLPKGIYLIKVNQVNRIYIEKVVVR